MIFDTRVWLSPSSTCFVPLGSATGFLYKFGQDIALVSNWHVFSGVHALTGVNLNTNRGYVPNRVEFYISLLDPRTLSVVSRPQNVIFVDNWQSLWWQHKEYRGLQRKPKVVDIWRARAQRAHRRLCVDQRSNRRIAFSGPRASRRNRQSPICQTWLSSRCSRAVYSGVFQRPNETRDISDLEAGVRRIRATLSCHPVIFIDAVTRDGMSGSPVLYFGNEITDEFGDPVPEAVMTLNEPWLVGVYAGRECVTDEENEMTIGRVWRKSLLDEIFFQRVPGRRLPLFTNGDVTDAT